jgi:hypothetical protein
MKKSSVKIKDMRNKKKQKKKKRKMDRHSHHMPQSRRSSIEMFLTISRKVVIEA